MAVFIILGLFPGPSEGARYPIGGEWEYSGTRAITLDGKSAELKDGGKITIESDYYYDRWRRDYDERVLTFRVKGKYTVSPAPSISENYEAAVAVNRWYNFSYEEVERSGVKYRLTVTGRGNGEVRITRTIEGESVTAVFPARRIRWDGDWDDYYYGGNLFGVEVGCSIVGFGSVLLVIPLLFLCRRR